MKNVPSRLNVVLKQQLWLNKMLAKYLFKFKNWWVNKWGGGLKVGGGFLFNTQPQALIWSTQELRAFIASLQLTSKTSCSSSVSVGPTFPWPHREIHLALESLHLALFVFCMFPPVLPPLSWNTNPPPHQLFLTRGVEVLTDPYAQPPSQA